MDVACFMLRFEFNQPFVMVFNTDFVVFFIRDMLLKRILGSQTEQYFKKYTGRKQLKLQLKDWTVVQK